MAEPETPLDLAHAAMESAPEDGAARLQFYERLVEGELFLMLAAEPVGAVVEPRIFPLDDGDYVLVYDREDRLSRFAGGPTPYAALAGRRVVEMLAQRDIGLGLNLGEAPSKMLLPPEVVDWLAETLSARPTVADAQPREIAPPSDLPQALLTAIDGKLARMGGLAARAYLAQVTYDTGAQSHLLAFIDPADGAEDTLARAVGEALTFSGLETGSLDVAFLADSHILSARLSRAALRFDLPTPEVTEPPRPPGSDPDAPPRLR